MLFDLSIIGETYTTPIRNTNIQIVMRRENNGVASLYFRTAAGLQLDIPDGIRLYCRDTIDPNRRLLQYPINSNMYVVCPSDKYWVEYQGDVVLTLNPMRAWRIVEPGCIGV